MRRYSEFQTPAAIERNARARHVCERHPYIAAHVAYVRGDLHSTVAVALVSRDREFIAECELKGLPVVEAAQHVVRNVWNAQRISGRLPQ